MCINSDIFSFIWVNSAGSISGVKGLPVDISLAQNLVMMRSWCGGSLDCFFLAIFWSLESEKWKKWGAFHKVETQHQNKVSLCSCYLTCTYHFQKILALHPCSGIYHSEFLLWCKINAQDWQVTETFMTCLTMREGPFLWLHACTKFAPTTLGSSPPTEGLLQEVQLRERTWLLKEALGHLDLLITWTA